MEEFDAVLTGNSKWAVVRADCKDAANSLPENCLDGAIIDPPAGISFMASSSRTWDSDRGGRDKWIAWLTERLQAIYRALKPGAHILVWSLPRTSAWTGIAVEDAGFEVRDVISHLFGSGFPKSMNISKQLDKMAGAEREITGPYTTPEGGQVLSTYNNWQSDAIQEGEQGRRVPMLSKPATPEARRWEGWGTALKPSQEMWWLGRKPISESTLALNILKWGVGAINIDKTRIPHANAQDLAEHEKMVQAIKSRGGSMEGSWKNSSDLSGASDVNLGGRWPSNLVLSHSPECKCVGTQKVKGIVGGTSPRGIGFSGIEGTGDMPTAFNYADSEGMETVESWECAPGCPVAEMNAQSGSSSSPQSYQRNTASGNVNSYSPGIGDPAGKLSLNYGDKGGASRFFPVFSHDPTLESDLDFAPFLYTPKPSRSEKNKGCENLPIPTTTVRIREGLTQTEKEWVLAELKRCGVPL